MDATEGWKKCQGKEKNVKNIIFVLNKYQDVTHVSASIFQGLFNNIVFRSVALVTKKVMGYLNFFHIPDFFPPCIIPYK